MHLKNLWLDRFKTVHGFEYPFTARDGKAVNTLLTLNMPAEELVGIAAQAWTRQGYPFTQAAKLSGFADGYPIIRVALQKPAMINGKIDHREAKRAREHPENIKPKILVPGPNGQLIEKV